MLHRPFYGQIIFKSLLRKRRKLPVADPAAGYGGGAKKHEIYAATFSGHLFYDLFLQALGPLLDPLPASFFQGFRFWIIYTDSVWAVILNYIPHAEYLSISIE